MEAEKYLERLIKSRKQLRKKILKFMEIFFAIFGENLESFYARLVSSSLMQISTNH